MLGEVVGTVELPEEGNVVHQAVVPVEPKIGNDGVERNLQRQKVQVHRLGSHVAAIREEDQDGWAESDGRQQRVGHLLHRGVRHIVSAMLVAIEVAVALAKTSQHAKLMDSKCGKGKTIVGVRKGNVHVPAGEVVQHLMADKRHRAPEDDECVHLPVGQVRDGFALLMHGDGNADTRLVNVEDAKEVVGHGPAIFVRIQSPRRLEGVLGVALYCRSSCRCHFDVILDSTEYKKKLNNRDSSVAGPGGGC